jgi:threonine synthase
MLYYSTNHDAEKTDFKTALFKGQAPDRGLYMPEAIPALTSHEIHAMKNASYASIAETVLEKFLSGAVSRPLLAELCAGAYDFPVPIELVSGRRHVMRLDRGPTASFKDFAARMMARLMDRLRSEPDERLVVLTATSGDTGSAIAHAFSGIRGIDVIVLFPPDEVSVRQRKQMTTIGGNVTAIGVDGKFDHCQAMVKQAFSDPDLASIPLTSANSINIGRLLPQSVYYAYAYSRLAEYPEPLAVSVPSGNFGNLMGALLAGRMGIPMAALVLATNANDEVPSFLETGAYHKIDPSRVCISNAMNVGHPSNFARVVDLYGGWMDEKGNIRRSPDLNRMRRDLFAVSVDDADTRAAIQNAWERHHLLLEPHGAVGWTGLERYFEAVGGGEPVSVAVETAHPAKFPDEIEGLLGFAPETPPSLSCVETRPETFERMSAEYREFKAFLSGRYV